MAVHYLGDNGPDGMAMGTGTSEKIAFYGTTPVTQQASADLATVATAASSASFASDQAAVVNDLVAAVNEIRSCLVNLGLHKGAA